MNQIGPVRVSLLKMLLVANSSLDWRAFEWSDGECAELDVCGLEPADAFPQLQAYQRILRILPRGEEHRALPLLESGLHSAIQIAGIPRHTFLAHWAQLFPGEEARAAIVYRNALCRRGELLHRHMNDIQRNEPHYRAARFK